MNIYFVHKNSTLKGPFDIRNAEKKPFMQIGDYCLRSTEHELSLLWVTSERNSWMACSCVATASSDSFSASGNTLLFTSDGLHCRSGKLHLLKELSRLFAHKPAHQFFLEAIAILNYEKDLWNASLLVALHSSKPSSIRVSSGYPGHLNEAPHPSERHPFSHYLDPVYQKRLSELRQQGYSLKDCYQTIRKESPQGFRTALRKFLSDYPNGSIYDTE